MSARRWVRATTLAVLLTSVLLGIVGGLYLDGYRLYIIHTGSMEPTLMPGDVVFDKPVAEGTLKVGQIITFRHSALTTDVVTHRFTGYTATGLITTKGDANATPDPWQIRPGQVKGADALTLPKVGYLIVFLKQPAGVASVVLGVLAMIFLWGLFFPASAAAAVTRHRHRRARNAPAAFLPPPAPVDISMDDTVTFSLDVGEFESLFEDARV